mgnify:CR=1 FL=1
MSYQGACSSWKINDITNSQCVRDIVYMVSSLKDREARAGNDRSIIVEDLGDWYNEVGATHESGYFMKLRLAPLDAHRADVQDAVWRLIDGFVESFPKRILYSFNLLGAQHRGTTRVDPPEVTKALGKGDSIIVIVHLHSNLSTNID